MSALSWRIATVTDEPEIRELTRAAYAKWIAVIGREPKPMTANYRLALLRHRFDLLEDNGVAVGLIETFCARQHLFIENVAVPASHQGQGLGHRLLDYAETIAVACGMREIRLNTNAAFTENVRLYTAVGYSIFAQSEIADGTVVHMAKAL